MATPVQRALATLEAINNGALDQALLLRIADAFIGTYFANVENPTNEQKAQALLWATRNYIKDIVRAYESRAAADAARLASVADVDANVDIGSGDNPDPEA